MCMTCFYFVMHFSNSKCIKPHALCLKKIEFWPIVHCDHRCNLRGCRYPSFWIRGTVSSLFRTLVKNSRSTEAICGSTRPVNSGSGNRALRRWMIVTQDQHQSCVDGTCTTDWTVWNRLQQHRFFLSLSLSLSLGGDLSVWNWKRIKSSGSVLYWNSVQVDWWFNNRGHRTILLYWTIVNFIIIIIIIIIIINNEFVYVMFIPHPPWPLLINDVGLELEGTLINCSLL